jgi:hypothetical protein
VTEPHGDIARRDFLSGIVFVGLGAVGAIVAYGYSIGTASRMGPGYFPLVISGLLVGVGAILIVSNIRSCLRSRLPRIRALENKSGLAAFLVVVSCIVAFAVLIERTGLAITSFVCVAIAYFGARGLMQRQGSVWEGALVAWALSAFSVIVFVYALGLPMRVWPR